MIHYSFALELIRQKVGEDSFDIKTKGFRELPVNGLNLRSNQRLTVPTRGLMDLGPIFSKRKKIFAPKSHLIKALAKR